MTEEPIHRHQISFRPFSLENDLPTMYDWLSDEDVRTWYDEGEHSLENYAQKFAPEEGMHRYLILVEGEPIGYIQAYWLSNEPEYAEQIALPHDAVSMDILIGERTCRGRGIGTGALRAFVESIVFGEMDAEYACINPDPANARAVRSYEKAGFRGERVVDILAEEPGDAGPERIMVLARSAWRAGSSGYGC